MCIASQHTAHSPSVTMEKTKFQPWRIVARTNNCSCRQFPQYALVFALFVPTRPPCRDGAPLAKSEIEILFILQTGSYRRFSSVPGGVARHRITGAFMDRFGKPKPCPLNRAPRAEKRNNPVTPPSRQLRPAFPAIPRVGLRDAFPQRNPRSPTEISQPRNIQQLPRRAVGLRRVKG